MERALKIKVQVLTSPPILCKLRPLCKLFPLSQQLDFLFCKLRDCTDPASKGQLPAPAPAPCPPLPHPAPLGTFPTRSTLFSGQILGHFIGSENQKSGAFSLVTKSLWSVLMLRVLSLSLLSPHHPLSLSQLYRKASNEEGGPPTPFPHSMLWI